MFLPLYSLVMNWVFPLRFRFIGLNTFMDLRALYVCLAMNTRGDNGVSYWFTWYMLWHSTRGFPRWYWGNLCIGVDAGFSPTETLGSLYSSLCGLSIMNMNLLWCYFSMNSRIDRIEKIALRYFSTNTWTNQTERGGFIPYKQFLPVVLC